MARDIHRRSLMLATSGLAVAAMAPLPATIPEMWAEIERLDAEWDALMDRYAVDGGVSNGIPGSRTIDAPEYFQQERPIEARINDLTLEIARTPCRNPQDLRAKAAATQRMFPMGEWERGNPPAEILNSLLRELGAA